MIPEFNGDLIQWLRGFYYTATTGSMTAATSKMNRNQSAMTHQIRSLENEFGVKLFTGTKAKRVLTTEGKYLLGKTIQIFTLINELHSNITSTPNELHGNISLNATYTAFNYFLPDVVASFSKFYPDVQFKLTGEATAEALFTNVRSGAVDFGLVGTPSIPTDLIAHPLFNSPMSLITAKGYLTHGTPASLADIATMPFIATPADSSLWLYLKRLFEDLGISMQCKHRIDQQEVIKDYVSKGMGVTILENIACTGCEGRLDIYPLDKLIPARSYRLVHLSNKNLSQPQTVFLKFLLHACENFNTPQQP